MSDDLVVLHGLSGDVVFRDSREHVDDALLRLLMIDDSRLAAWAAQVESVDGTLEAVVQAISAGWVATGGADWNPLDWGADGALDIRAISESPDYSVRISRDRSFGALCMTDESGEMRVETSPPEYEEAYFLGDRRLAGGYGDYKAQESWRMEKARRHATKLGSFVVDPSAPILDIGCGYGFTRVALGELGFLTDGVEVSEHAIEYMREVYGMDCRRGVVEDQMNTWSGHFSGACALDVIEHVADPVAFLRVVRKMLQSGAPFLVKTPNVDSLETRVFGPDYHSFKREHLALVSPRWFEHHATSCGFRIADMSTTSHLLRGFLGDEHARSIASAGLGSDIEVVLVAE